MAKLVARKQSRFCGRMIAKVRVLENSKASLRVC